MQNKRFGRRQVITPVEGGGHELGHGYDYEVNGIKNFWDAYGTWFEYTSASGKQIVINNSEKVAGTIENLIRAEHNIPLRDSYSPLYPAETKYHENGTSIVTKAKNFIGIGLLNLSPFINYNLFNLSEGVDVIKK